MKQTIQTSKLRAHPDNPRVIRSNEFDKLVRSIQDFPEMLSIRPIVCNLNHEVLGGNQRLEAIRFLGIEQIEVDMVDLSEDKQREFLIKDNTQAGNWDMDIIANEFDVSTLEDWGFELPNHVFENDSLDFDPDRSEETKENKQKCECCGK